MPLLILVTSVITTGHSFPVGYLVFNSPNVTEQRFHLMIFSHSINLSDSASKVDNRNQLDIARKASECAAPPQPRRKSRERSWKSGDRGEMSAIGAQKIRRWRRFA